MTNNELVHAVLTVIDAKDWSRLATLITPDIVYDQIGRAHV